MGLWGFYWCWSYGLGVGLTAFGLKIEDFRRRACDFRVGGIWSLRRVSG